MKANKRYDRYYLSYTGVGLPLKLVNSLAFDETNNRNTFFAVMLDKYGHEALIHKVVYGEVEMSHNYNFTPSGELISAEITDIEGATQTITFG